MYHRPAHRGHRPETSPIYGVWSGGPLRLPRALAVLVLGLWAGAGAALDASSYSGSIEPCLSPHGDRDRYLDGLLSVGWTQVRDQDRQAALAVLADTFLPAIGQIDSGWPDHMAFRAAAAAFWADLSRNRILMTREDQVLLLAGFATDQGEMVVECWVAGPQTRATDDFLILAGTAYQGDGVVMTQLNMSATPDRPRTEIFVSRLTPPVPVDPPLAGTDGLRSRITFDRPEIDL